MRRGQATCPLLSILAEPPFPERIRAGVPLVEIDHMLDKLPGSSSKLVTTCLGKNASDGSPSTEAGAVRRDGSVFFLDLGVLTTSSERGGPKRTRFIPSISLMIWCKRCATNADVKGTGRDGAEGAGVAAPEERCGRHEVTCERRLRKT